MSFLRSSPWEGSDRVDRVGRVDHADRIEDRCPPAVSIPASEWDVAMRDALARETVEILAHQVGVERKRTVTAERSDLLFSTGLVATVVVIGYSRSQSKKSGRKSGARGSRRR